MASCLITNLGNSANADSICQAKEQSYPWTNKQCCHWTIQVSIDNSNTYHLPVCLPWADNDPGRSISNGDKTLITGWGRTQNPSIDNESDVVFSIKLQKVPVAISNDKCQKGDKFEVDPKIQLCAGGEKGIAH